MATSLPPGSFRLFWLASNIDQIKGDNQQAFTSLERISKSVQTFTHNEVCLDRLMDDSSSERIVLLASGALGQYAVPIIHDKPEIDSIFIFCIDKTRHEQWTKAWPKVKGVFDQIEAMCQAVAQLIQPPSPKKDVLEVPEAARRRRGHSASHARAPSSTRASDQKSTESSKPALDIAAARPEHKTREAFVEPKPAPSRPVVKEKAHSPVRLFHTNAGRSSPLINSLRSTEHGSTSDFDRLDQTIVATTEQDVRASLFNDANLYRSTSMAKNTIDRLQSTLVQTIEKHVTKKSNDSEVLNKLFAELKQAVVETLIQQQQPTQLRDIIKQSVADALVQQQQKPKLDFMPTTTTTMVPRSKPIVVVRHPEVRISANPQQTRADAAFRQQRGAVVANQALRDAVQRWSAVQSMADLAVAIKKCGKNDLECAWLLFCWIVQNIRYQPNCNINAAEAVFRTKRGVCRGFVSLYHECCSLLGIQCYEIAGYSRQTLLKTVEDLGEPMHAWNSIVLDDFTYLLDSTWGVGSGENEEKVNDFYFLTSPEELIYSHFAPGYQLLKPEITKQDFVRLPLMRATYYRLGLQLQSPKQGLNETNQNIFQIVIRKPEDVDLLLNLKVGNSEYPTSLHTLCQRDEKDLNLCNCYIAPPTNGLYDVVIYGKTSEAKTYQDAIQMKLRVSNITDAFCFPMIYSIFMEKKCILIAPLRRFVSQDEQVLIHAIIPNGNVVEVRNGRDYMVPCKTEYKNGVLKKEVRVQGDLQVLARWDDNADSISVLCSFTMI